MFKTRHEICDPYQKMYFTRMLCDVVHNLLHLQTVFTQLNKSVRVLTSLINEKKKTVDIIYGKFQHFKKILQPFFKDSRHFNR